MEKIVIIGAGLTGLSAAYHLEKQGFYNYKIFEKESEPGGLCRSIHQDGFTFDYTGHLLHIGDQYFRSLIQSVVGTKNFNLIKRKSFIFSHDTYTHYPFQVNLRGLPTNIISDCIEGFINKKNYKHPLSKTIFYYWALKHFGRGMAKHFFFPYQKKIFCYDLKKLSTSWMGRFVPKTSLDQIIEGITQDPEEKNIGYNSQFYYPKKDGINYWVQKFAETLKNPIHISHHVKYVDLKNKAVIFSNGTTENFTKLITTMPLNILLRSLKEPSNSFLKSKHHKLLCNSVLNFNLGIDRPNISDMHWAYFPEKKYPFYRMGFYHNFSNSLVPKNHSSLYGEISYRSASAQKKENLILNGKNAAKNILNFSDKNIATEKILDIKPAYVIYDRWRDKNLSKIHRRLNEDSVHSIGRYGEWKYSSMQEAILDGKQTVEKILPRKN